MFNILKCELFKLRKSKSFWIMILANTLISATSFFMFTAQIESGALINFEINGVSFFLSAFSDSGLYIVYGVIFAVTFICGDFDNRTLQSGISAGCGRLKVFLGKSLVYLAAVSLTYLPYPILNFILASARYGYGVDISADVIIKLVAISFAASAAYSALLSLCALLSFVLQKTGGVIGGGLSLLIGGELLGMAAVAFPAIENVYLLSPYSLVLSVSDMTTGYGDIVKTAILSCVYIAVIFTATYMFFRKAEMK